MCTVRGNQPHPDREGQWGREPGRAKGTVSAKGLRQKQHRVMVSLIVFVLDTGVLSAMEESLRFEVQGKLSSVGSAVGPQANHSTSL